MSIITHHLIFTTNQKSSVYNKSKKKNFNCLCHSNIFRDCCVLAFQVKHIHEFCLWDIVVTMSSHLPNLRPCGEWVRDNFKNVSKESTSLWSNMIKNKNKKKIQGTVDFLYKRDGFLKKISINKNLSWDSASFFSLEAKLQKVKQLLYSAHYIIWYFFATSTRRNSFQSHGDYCCIKGSVDHAIPSALVFSQPVLKKSLGCDKTVSSVSEGVI